MKRVLAVTFGLLWMASAAAAADSAKTSAEPAAPKSAAQPPAPKRKAYFFVMLKSGPTRDQDRATTEKIQEGHLAHLTRAAASGKLLIAGPFEDDGEWRGILIYDVKTMAEAKALCDADPAVKSGRLVCDIHPWWGETGATLK